MNRLALALTILLSGIGKVVLNPVDNKVQARYRPCNFTVQWLDTKVNPPMCRPCKSCMDDEYEIASCTQTQDRVCSYCEIGQVYSEMDDVCRPCGCCDGKHQVQLVCLAAGFHGNEACISDGPCPRESSNLSLEKPVVKEPSRNVSTVTPSIAESSTNNVINTLLVVAGAVLVGAALVIILYCIWRHRKKKPQVEYTAGDTQVMFHNPEVCITNHCTSGQKVTLPQEETTPGQAEYSGNSDEPEGPSSTLMLPQAEQPFTRS